MWSGIEAHASVICACLPCYAPLLKVNSRIKSILTSLRTRSSRRGNFSSRPANKSPSDALRRVTSSAEYIEPFITSFETKIERGAKMHATENELEMGHILKVGGYDSHSIINWNPTEAECCSFSTHHNPIPASHNFGALNHRMIYEGQAKTQISKRQTLSRLHSSCNCLLRFCTFGCEFDRF